MSYDVRTERSAQPGDIGPRRSPRWLLSLAVVAVLLIGPGTVAAAPAGTASPSPGAARHVPVLAYFDIWFQASSWDRGKSDYPALGRYSSDDADVMRRQVQWAKAAGIDGFIVAWKSTEILDARLDQLVQLADQEGFKLAIAYEGLDARRQALSPEAASSAFDYLSTEYGSDSAFDLFGRPLIILSGTPAYSREAIAQIVQPRRARLRILASEPTVDGYQRIADLVDGDAYRWSSVDPATTPGYPAPLTALSSAVHARGGLWIAPAAPGYDARAVGGTRVVARQGGVTLRRELTAAFDSKPDAVGLVSWNGFGEGTQVEPSCVYGSVALATIAALRGGRLPTDVPTCPTATPVASPVATPTASPAVAIRRAGHGRASSTSGNGITAVTALLGVIGVVVASLILIGRRNRPGEVQP